MCPSKCWIAVEYLYLSRTTVVERLSHKKFITSVTFARVCLVFHTRVSPLSHMLRRPPSRIELKSEDKEEVCHRVNCHSCLFRFVSLARNIIVLTVTFRTDDAQFELLRRDYLATRELGAPTTPQDTADRARLAREHERARRLGLNRSLQPPPQ